ncbi:MAG: FAD-dependent oxidoreductase [Verrucomicrobia bacterium]|nr:FAD-dependent oxidoreductase [Verrucomicrobiota bacterium]MCF7707651.1 FAD-dependent oxidoreductase [Verrucomicrobiota bacterium]
MMNHDSFHYHSLDQLRHHIDELGLNLEFTEDLEPLFQPIRIGQKTLPNRFAVLPMEGCDGDAGGAPGELTFRRYKRFASGGAGILWFEATAVVHEGRANPRQLYIHRGTRDAFARLVDSTLSAAKENFNEGHRPLLILQLTHSGRYSRPERHPSPIIAHHSKYLDPRHGLPPDYPLISDAVLEALEERYVEAAVAAKEAGFDGVDIKACHRYLVSELLASFTREESRYGGDFENRTRFLRNVVKKVKSAVPELIVTSRMNAYDAMAYPYGFGMAQGDEVPDLTEPRELVRMLEAAGAPLVNVTIGNPYFNPHVNRPFDLPTIGAPTPSEHPLRGVERFVEIVRDIQREFPAFPVIGGGYSWLRQFFPYLAAENVRNGDVSIVGLGRMSFAYPDFIRDLLETGKLDTQKVCVACSACTQIMRDGGRTGCVPRDGEIYGPIFKAGRAEATDTNMKLAEMCRRCNDPQCISCCPARVDIPEFVSLIAEGRFKEAYEELCRANPLPAVCGYVCPSEILCESGCINRHYSESVPIRHLQRWISKKALEESWAPTIEAPAPVTGKKVAVLGGGPAGISAAAMLAVFGHSVDLIDKSGDLGGVAGMTIPGFRLPDDILQREIKTVFARHKDRIQFKQAVIDSENNLKRLVESGYDAALVALGLQETIPLPGARRPESGVFGAMEFLARAKREGSFLSPLPETVLVLGGGNTAIDAAVAAKKLGVAEVNIVYRRSFVEMPAWPAERDHALELGVNFLTLTAPIDYVLDEQGRLKGLKVRRTRLTSPGADGRRRPEPVPDSDHVLWTTCVVEAIGQKMGDETRRGLTRLAFTDSGLISLRADGMETSVSGIFAAGDMVNGGTTVVQAVAEGVQAAHQINEFLSSEPVSIRFNNHDDHGLEAIG